MGVTLAMKLAGGKGMNLKTEEAELQKYCCAVSTDVSSLTQFHCICVYVCSMDMHDYHSRV